MLKLTFSAASGRCCLSVAASQLLLVFLLLITTNLKAQDLVSFRIVNSVMHTNKVTQCKAYFNKQERSLTLRSTNSNQIFQIVNNGDETYQIRFYSNGALEATKIIYRRKDLQGTSSNLIYTSRTGEILFTISNL